VDGHPGVDVSGPRWGVLARARQGSKFSGLIQQKKCDQEIGFKIAQRYPSKILVNAAPKDTPILRLPALALTVTIDTERSTPFIRAGVCAGYRSRRYSRLTTKRTRAQIASWSQSPVDGFATILQAFRTLPSLMWHFLIWRATMGTTQRSDLLGADIFISWPAADCMPLTRYYCRKGWA